MRHPRDVLKELLANTKPVDGPFNDATFEKDCEKIELDRFLFEGAMQEFQEILLDNPLQPLSYAGIAYCKAKLGEDPRVVFGFFFASLQFNFSNPVVWSLVADYAKSRAEKSAWQPQPQNLDPYYVYNPLYEKPPSTEEALLSPSPSSPPSTKFYWTEIFLLAFLGITAISLAGLLVVVILK